MTFVCFAGARPQSRLSWFLRCCSASLAAFLVTAGAASSTALGGEIIADVPRSVPVSDLGPARQTAIIEISLTLNHRDEAALQNLIAMQNEPRSPLFRHFLSNAQFNAAFSPTPASYSRVITFLQANGFRIIRTFQDDSRVKAVGTIANVNRVFGVNIHTVTLFHSHYFGFMNESPAHEPAALRGLIFSIDGLDNVYDAADESAKQQQQQQRLAISSKAMLPVVSPNAGSPPDYYLTPSTIEQAYSLPNLVGNISTGIITDGIFNDADLTAYLKYFGIVRGPNVVTPVPVDGGPPSPAPGPTSSPYAAEATGDVETVAALAPAANIYVYEFNGSSSPYENLLDAIHQVVSENRVAAVSISHGYCETAVGTTYATEWSQAAAEGASKGITFIAAAGDWGPAAPGCTGAAVSVPASSPYFTAIGGTLLDLHSGLWSNEVVWDNASKSNGIEFGASPGGVSTIFTSPTNWPQPKLPGVISGHRNVPDVSVNAGTPTAMYYLGSWTAFGGTSFGAALFNAEVIEADEYTQTHMGLASSFLYNEFLQRGYGIDQPYFHDIVTGCNPFFYTLNNVSYNLPGTCAKPGYDQVSGIGSPVWANLLLPQKPFQTLYQFNGPEFQGLKDGASPQARLLNLDGALYGTTTAGGDNNCGSVFEMIPPLTEKILYSFTCTPGNTPSDLVADKTGALYGTTSLGGKYNGGTVFKIQNGIPSVIHSFGGPNDGSNPIAGLIYDGDVLYGTTNGYPINGYGTVFSMTTSGTENVLWKFHSQNSLDPVGPESDLLNVGGTLYGTSHSGGRNDAGTVFKLNTNGQGKEVVYSFNVNSDIGTNPVAPVINVGNKLYGTTTAGGSSGHGTVFEVSTSGSGEMPLYKFGNQLFTISHSGLLCLNGHLYGTTYAGGSADNGYLYSLPLQGGTPTVLQNFNQYSIDGGFPEAQLINVNGTLYGTTSAGPNGIAGTVFSYSVASPKTCTTS